ncbi:alkaline phosphatase [Halomonas sp. V046]|uniref:alkaline phosphatase n=1 Tax=Halomonas sp. V046 TaxID=3459611 RepID=UPI004044A4C2
MAMSSRGPRLRVRPVAWLLVLLGVLWGVARSTELVSCATLSLGAGPLAPGFEALWQPPWGMLVIAAWVTLVPVSGRWCWLVAAVVVLAAVLRLVEAVTWAVLGREMNLWLDAALLGPLYGLLATNLGSVTALVVVALMGLALVAGVAALSALLARASRAAMAWSLGGRLALFGGLGALMVSLTLAYGAHFTRQDVPLGTTLVEQGRRLLQTLGARHGFDDVLARQGRPVAPLPGLAGRDVILIFIESYGMSLVQPEPFREEDGEALRRGQAREPVGEALRRGQAREPVGEALRRGQRVLADAGLSVASGRLRSPIRGGQSWLAHASVLSGITIDNPLWYRLMLASRRGTLVQDFAASGHRTLALMPAITRVWPEGQAYRFDHLLDSRQLGYAGPALNWVTMPDQYTLDHFQRRWRDADGAAMFAQLALISSHAPWTPVVPVLDWNTLGDGRVFREWQDAGPTPRQLWSDMGRVREHYAEAVAYSLTVTLEWAARSLGPDALVMIMGDHPAAPVVTGAGASPDVPVHVISADPDLVAPFLGGGMTPGLVPGEEPAMRGLSSWRGSLHRYFGESVTGATSGPGTGSESWPRPGP